MADPDGWGDVLGGFCQMFSGVIGLLAVTDPRDGRIIHTESWGNPAIVEPLLKRGMSELPFVEAIPRLEVDIPLTVDRFYEIQGPETQNRWRSSALNRDWAIPNGIDDCIWLPVLRQVDAAGNLVIVTGCDRPQISDGDLADVAELAPHVRRAITISNLVDERRGHVDLFAELLDRLSCAVVVVDAAMKVLYANGEAEDLLRERGLVSTHRATLTLHWPMARAAVEMAVSLGRTSELLLGTAGLGVPMTPGLDVAVAHVMPLARRDLSVRVNARAAAAIFIVRPGRTQLSGLDAVAALFGLTAAEKRVAGQISSGMLRPEIALSNGVVEGTVKVQLSAIFDKTGARDQRSLALLIRDLTPPVREI
ncbi:MAG: hypothetical protein B7Z02_09530 [Rhodobacterales bacterium 32-67-9]|nr:MAG: hypothetical protein B7Z02_09530 [Rhodobacterales bacterium 32-67-9]